MSGSVINLAGMSGPVINYHHCMARWEPDSRGRLEQAALALFRERGFEHTTVAEIAERAGVTERTFFRQFTDKREVLFAGSPALLEVLVSAIADAPEDLAAMDAAAAGIAAAGARIEERRDLARQRQAVIAASAELRERELIKLAAYSAAVADALRERGVEDPAAHLTAEIAIAVFRIAVDRWAGDAGEDSLPEVIRASFEELRSVTAG
ncbi:MAG: Transcriptional regulator, AcrR family [uncultured Solirubrobacteraceae bacterium]|uniref:Transcriptional regulator, AcrR family n=1 Tax=uncultured Solirubrobacteraceae bacterium TaxID=1162706 RepID=A0A6J4T947_9ACTN|nr:MAG: Transcriptional regulator, AcrR family [uncultured Solirubrobacteraceae bacterium]